MLDQSSLCSILSLYRKIIKIRIAVGLLFAPRNKKVMEPCHVTGMFQTPNFSAVCSCNGSKSREGSRKM
jgi:hypothetical protein